jgi:hypothetical protein
MSDTEEVVITRTKAEPKPPKNTKPEIAREKLKEKRERLKKEKENMIIEEAKKRMISESEKKLQEEALAKQQEEEKKKSDPTYIMMQKMEQMMSMFNKPIPTGEGPVPKKRASKKVVIPEPEPEPEIEEKPKRKPRVVKEPKPVENKSPGLPKPRKKVVYLQQDPVMEESTQFVGYDVAPPAEPIQYHSSSGLLSAMMGRRNMSSYYE